MTGHALRLVVGLPGQAFGAAAALVAASFVLAVWRVRNPNVRRIYR